MFCDSTIVNREQKDRYLSSENANPNANKHWESVHICQDCGLVINLAEMDFKAVTTGMIECPRCKHSGLIEIQIVERDGTAE